MTTIADKILFFGTGATLVAASGFGVVEVYKRARRLTIRSRDAQEAAREVFRTDATDRRFAELARMSEVLRR